MVERVVIAEEPTGPVAPGAEQTTEQQQQQQAQPTNERPTWLPEKFKSVEDMAKAYDELEKKLHGPDKAKQEQEQPDKKPEGTAQEQEQQARNALEQAGIKFDALQTEFLEKGELSEDSYNKLLAAGFPKEVVDGYIQGQQAVAEQITNAIKAEVGGEENFDVMIQWAAANMSVADKKAFNAAMDSDNVDTMKMAVRDLASRYAKENGSEPRLVTGNAAKGSGDVYRSNEEVLRDISDPRYAADPAFRAEVERKVMRSQVL